VTILWNTVPFHPAVEGRPLTNRTPTASERRGGEEWLSRIVSLTQPHLIVAVGLKATITLKALNLGGLAVRHPANGGATLFREQLRSIARDRGLV
jgi:uracil-DNA glycosylase